MYVAKHKIAVTKAVRRTDALSLEKFGKGFVVLAERLVDDPQIRGRDLLARIDLFPQLINLPGLLQIASDEVMVVGFDVKLLPFTDVRTEFVGFPGVFRREDFLAEVVIAGA